MPTIIGESVTDLDVALKIESLIRSAGYRVCFPTCVLPDTVVSNVSPTFSSTTDLEYRICTFDFGLIGPQGEIIDTAITCCKDKSLEPLLEEYRQCILNIQEKLNTLLKTRQIIVKDITEVVDDQFKTMPQLAIIPHCGSHTIAQGVLHSAFIPMTRGIGTRKELELTIGPEIRFTIEPHVIILDDNIKWKCQSYKGTIVRDKDYNLDTTDKRLDNLISAPVETFSYLKTSYLSFFEEQTYIIRGNKLHRLSL